MIYLDNNSSTKVAEKVLNDMIPYFCDYYGNPSGVNNQFCRIAENAVLATKGILKQYFNAQSINDFIFTSGATESNNAVLKGVASYYSATKGRIIVSNIEHKSVLSTCAELALQGYDIKYVPSDYRGLINVNSIENEITDDTILIAIMAANNELGTIQPINEIGAIAREHNILFFSDMTQYIGSHRVDLQAVPIDFISFSAHKIYGPKGVGCLYANNRGRSSMMPLINGGKQQLGLRSGTLNVPGIVGLGSAISIIDKDLEMFNNNIIRLRKRFFNAIDSSAIERINGDYANCIPGTINITFKDITSMEIMQHIPELVISTGSSCLEGDSSYVLHAIGLSDDQIKRSIRIGIGRYNTLKEIDTVTYLINKINEEKIRRRCIN